MSENTWAFSQSFTLKFKAMRSDLDSRIKSATAKGPPSQDLVQELSISLVNITKVLGDATGLIPSYDQKLYEDQLKALEQSIESLRTSAPKQKFSFKRKIPTPGAPQPQLTSSSSTLEINASENDSQVVSTSVVLYSRSNEYLTKAAFDTHTERTDLSISDLDNCVVDLLTNSDPNSNGVLKISALHIRNITNCVLLLPIVEGSALLHDLTRCTIVLGCHQFRMHSSKKIDVFLSISSNPIIEHCQEIRFTGYLSNFLPSTLREQKLPTFRVQDFSHIRSTPSPHFSVMTTEEAKIIEDKFSCLCEDLLKDIVTIIPP